MKIHEFQAKEILKSYGVPVPKGGVAGTAEEAIDPHDIGTIR
jgi:succinyl-CoA synthetase beta subunit